MTTAAAAFRPTSTTLHTELSKEIRQAAGIFFTPAPIRTRLFELLAPHMSTPPSRILEPSFGSGEFLHDAAIRFPTSVTKLIGVELNRAAFLATAASIVTAPAPSRLCLSNTDFLGYKGCPHNADLIIGNPPYFVTEQKDPRAVKGRSNIFILFLYKCLTEHLAPGGLLGFVLPTSLYNSAYYDPCRKYIRDNTTILALEAAPADAAFFETAQDTMLLVLRNTPPPASASPPPFILDWAGSTYINPSADALRVATSDATTITALGCGVKTGEVVWNQHKEKLTDNPAAAAPVGSHPTTRIFYATNIKKDNTLTFAPPGKGKHPYICGFTGPAPNVGPALLVARGYGNTTYAINFARVPAGQVFYGENHVNVITGPAAALETIATSLSDPRTTTFIRQFVGNGALSKTELETVLPIWTPSS
jgi:adenine-specific DNA-methyltransferase